MGATTWSPGRGREPGSDFLDDAGTFVTPDDREAPRRPNRRCSSEAQAA